MTNSSLWHAFTVDTDEATITAAYQQRWGVAPQVIIRERTLTLAGPVPDTQKPDKVHLEVGDKVVVSGAYEAEIVSWNDDGTVTVRSEATGRTYIVQPEEIERFGPGPATEPEEDPRTAEDWDVPGA